MPSKGDSPHPTMDNIHVGVNGVCKLLKGLNVHKATGPDAIPTRFLHDFAAELAPIMTKLFQLSLDTRKIPDDWREASIVPVFKKGERQLASNYRPVSLTSVSCKLLEHIVHSQIMDHYDSRHLLSDQQHGFRSRRSCESQLLITVDSLAKSLDYGEQVDVILLDFSKAFDKVPHQRLLHKLDFYGVRGNTWNWVKDFLAKRTQQVTLEGQSSTRADVISGVPQGTVMGPLLFLTFINDLPEYTKSDVRLFADDCLLYRKVNSLADARQLQQDLSSLEYWEKQWQMEFHPQKCTVIHVTRKQRPIEHKYLLHGHTLEAVQSGKYLGVTLHNKLNWTEHICNIRAKSSKTLGFLRRNLQGCRPDVKATAYSTMVRPTLEYAATVWDPYHQSHIQSLKSVQRRAARFVKGNYYERSPGCVTAMLRDLQWGHFFLRPWVISLRRKMTPRSIFDGGRYSSLHRHTTLFQRCFNVDFRSRRWTTNFQRWNNVIDFNVGKTTHFQHLFNVRFQCWNNVGFQRWNNKSKHRPLRQNTLRTRKGYVVYHGKSPYCV